MSAPQPLRGMRVVELSQFIAGPTAGQLLADFGAQVVKIEPVVGDGSRSLPGTRFGSAYYRCFNTSKEVVVLDLAAAAGRDELSALIARADALVSNMGPAALRRLGLDPADLAERHPRLVVTLVSGFGQDDDRTCMDTIAQCESGFAWLNGNEDGTPRISTSWPVDFFAGMYAALSTAMALADQTRSDGTLIDLSMMEVASAMLLGPAAILISEGATLGSPVGNRDRASAPCNIYRCTDGYVYIYGGLDPYWAKLRPVVDGEQASFGERLARAADFDAVVERWTCVRTRDSVLARMAEIAVPAGAVREPLEAVSKIRSTRSGGATMRLPSGEHLPSFPALFSGERIERRPAKPLPGGTSRIA